MDDFNTEKTFLFYDESSEEIKRLIEEDEKFCKKLKSKKYSYEDAEMPEIRRGATCASQLNPKDLPNDFLYMAGLSADKDSDKTDWDFIVKGLNKAFPKMTFSWSGYFLGKIKIGDFETKITIDKIKSAYKGVLPLCGEEKAKKLVLNIVKNKIKELF